MNGMLGFIWNAHTIPINSREEDKDLHLNPVISCLLLRTPVASCLKSVEIMELKTDSVTGIPQVSTSARSSA